MHKDDVQRECEDTECAEGNDEHRENGDGAQARPPPSPAMQPLVQRGFKVPRSAPPFETPQFLLEALVVVPVVRFAHGRSRMRSRS